MGPRIDANERQWFLRFRAAIVLGTIAPSDYVGFGLFLAFGLCWIIFPNTVIAFYTSFHRGRIRPAKPVNIRVAGVLWVALILSVFVLFVLR